MRTHSAIRWTDALKDTGRSEHDLLSLESPLPQLDLYPASTQSLSSRDEAIFLLHIAAEIEHSLMVQYLYAMFSFGPLSELSSPQSDWVKSIRNIAKQEMGHLITVQNLALTLGGPITFEREDYPFRSDFYPFPMTLERPTRDVFAKYVVAEMPPLESITSLPTKHLVKEAMVRSEAANGGVAVNRVGALYSKLKYVVANIPEAEFAFATADTYQAAPLEIGQTSGPGGAHPMDSIMCWPITSKKIALDALDLIASQGEGPLHAASTSHFAQFLSIYQAFPESNPIFGVVAPNPCRPVPTNPRFSNGHFDLNAITAPIAVQLAQFGNLRYRLVLDGLSHYLLLNRKDRPNCKAYLATFATYEMANTITPVATHLTSLKRQVPDVFIGGLPAVAGMPFHMPYSLSLSPNESSRWRGHIGILRHSDLLAQQLVSDKQCPHDLRTVLKAIVSQDQDSLTQMNSAAEHSDMDCSD
jgi:hypothetical protein